MYFLTQVEGEGGTGKEGDRDNTASVIFKIPRTSETSGSGSLLISKLCLMVHCGVAKVGRIQCQITNQEGLVASHSVPHQQVTGPLTPILISAHGNTLGSLPQDGEFS